MFHTLASPGSCDIFGVKAWTVEHKFIALVRVRLELL